MIKEMRRWVSATTRFGLSDLPAGMGFVSVVAPNMWSEVADPGLPGRPTLVGAAIGDGVIQLHATAHPGRIGKHIGRVAQLQLFAKPRRDLIAVPPECVRRADRSPA